MCWTKTVVSVVTTSLLVSGLLGTAAAAEPTSSPGQALETSGFAVRYEDAVGDVPEGAGPDIVAITVDQPSASLVRFSVEFASDPPLTYDLATMTTDQLEVGLATEPDADIPGGYERAIIVHGATLPSAVETGANMYDETRMAGDEVLWGVVDVAVDGRIVTLTVERDLLGDSAQLAFFAVAMSEGPEGPAAGDAPVYDVCPDEDGLPGLYTYTVVGD